MKFSVIIPAWNAAGTISATLESVRVQTYGHWQAVIVDDGSTDATASIAHRYCSEDSRFSLVRQSNSGLSAARNTGIAAAKYGLLLFLDADDWIDPSYLEKFALEFEKHPEVDALVCGWQFTLEDGEEADVRFPPDAEDMFPFFSHTCPFVVHACVVNRRVIENAGVFDSTVGFVEDWDFWQRVSRTGARFKLIREVLAYYRMRKGSLSRKVYRSYEDARKMIHQGYAADQRVNCPVEKYRNGMPDSKINEHLCWLYCWYAGLCIGVGESIDGLTEPDLHGFTPESGQLALFIFEGVYRGGCFLPGQWFRFYQQHEKELDGFFDLLEEKTGSSSFIHDSKLELCLMIAERHTGVQMQMLGGIMYLPIDVKKTVDAIRAPVLKVVLSVWMNEVEIGKIDILPQNKILSSGSLKQAIGEEFAWSLMTDYLSYRYPDVPAEELQGGRGWELFLQELWGLQIREADVYDQSYNDNISYDTRENEEILRVDVEGELFNVRSEGKPLNVEYYVGGSKLGSFELQDEGQVVRAHVLRAAIAAHGKFEFCKAAVTQGLIGKDWSNLILREELQKGGGREI